MACGFDKVEFFYIKIEKKITYVSTRLKMKERSTNKVPDPTPKRNLDIDRRS